MRRGVGTEPGSVSERATRDTRKVRVGVSSIGLGASNGGVELQLPGRRAAGERRPLVVDASDSEVTRELNPSTILNSGEEVLWGAVSIDIGEEV